MNRERVERMWNRLKEWRAIATRYEKTARSFLSALHLAAACHGRSDIPQKCRLNFPQP